MTHDCRMGYPLIATLIAEQYDEGRKAFVTAPPRRFSPEEILQRKKLDVQTGITRSRPATEAERIQHEKWMAQEAIGRAFQDDGWVTWGKPGRPNLAPWTRVQYRFAGRGDEVFPMSNPPYTTACEMGWGEEVTAYRVVQP